MEKFDWKNKNLWLGVAALLVVILLIVVISKKRGGEEAPAVELTPESAEVVQEEAPKPVSRRTPSTKSTVAPSSAKMSYADALAKYKDTRIQFDTECRAVPNNVTYKDGTEIMIDNRAGVERKFTIGSTFTVPAYGFKIMKISSSALPYTYLVDCGDKQNVATILVQR